jgi:hypothetical protein
MTSAFIPFSDEGHVEEMRQWTRRELCHPSEPPKITRRFRFALLLRPPEMDQTWLEPRWHTAYEHQELLRLLGDVKLSNQLALQKRARKPCAFKPGMNGPSLLS